VRSRAEHVKVRRPTRLHFEPSDDARLTHYLFKYPAKFHPPVVRHLIDEYTKPGDTILDPFCGSGTLLVEAAVNGRSAIGFDIDPVAVFVSRVKTHRFKTAALRAAAETVLDELKGFSRSKKEYARRQFADIATESVARAVRREDLWIPRIPNIFHWFRKYVVVDLGRILAHIRAAAVPESHREFLLLCFASILRSASNADPVPVSGLEVTSHMKRRDELGRVVNPFDLFEKAVRRGLLDIEAYRAKIDRTVTLRAGQVDATLMGDRLMSKVDAVITSPPYNIAVNYYRRHQLEMFWLGFTESQEERLALLPKYIGRDKVPQSHPFVAVEKMVTPLVRGWEAHIRKVSPGRADAFKHYVVAMGKVLSEIADALKPDAHAVFVVGHSSWNGQELPMGRLFVELAGLSLTLTEHAWYPVRNRYMSYSRHNGASIDREYVLVFKKPPEKKR